MPCLDKSLLALCGGDLSPMMMRTIAEWREPLPTLTTDQMRQVDNAMIHDLGITLIQMMENAGRHLAVLSRELCGGSVESKSIMVLAGRGNNGGGGLVAARRLANWGARVLVVLADVAGNYRDVPGQQLEILRKMQAPIFVGAHDAMQDADLILDALIGYGMRGAPEGVAVNLIRAANVSAAPVLALDVPSGLDATSGEVFDPCVRADATLTLALPKIGLLGDAARAVVGDLYIADISVPLSVYFKIGVQVPNLFAHSEILHWRRHSPTNPKKVEHP